MKKTLFAIIATLLMVFALPYAFADEGTSDDSAGTKAESTDNSVSDAAEKSTGAAAPVPILIKAMEQKAKRIEPEKIEARTRIAQAVINDASGKVAEKSTEVVQKVAAAQAKIADSEAFVKLKAEQRERLKALQESQKERLKELSEEQIGKFANLDRARIKEMAALAPAEIAAKLKSMRIINASDDFRFRPLTVEQAQRSAKALEQLRKNEAKLREKYEERKSKLEQLKEKLHDCRNDSPEECAGVTEEAVTNAREAALTAAERVEAAVTKVKERIASSQDLTPEQAAEQERKIGELLGKVTGIKASIDAAATKKEVNEAVKKLKEIVSEAKKKINEHEQKLIRARVLGIFRSTEIMEKQLDCSVSRLSESGVDTSAAEAKLDSYTSLMVDARAKADEAKAASETDAEQAKALMKESYDKTMQARGILREVRQDLIDAGGQICSGKQEIAITDDELTGGAE